MGTIGDSCVGNVAKFTVAFPFVYHYLGGVRHIAWDRTPDMLTTESVEKSSYLLLGSAMVVSGGLAFVSL
jgi:succinate dehydrogenase (ubiquinone) cytochrome b560 subunit